MDAAVSDEKKRVAGAVRDYIARERMSREQFAFKTKLGKSTVDKLLIGLFSDKTLAAVEGQTGLRLRQQDPPPQTRAAPEPAFPAEAVPRQEITFHRTADGVCLAVASTGEGPVVVKTANWLNHLEQDWRGPVWGPLLRHLASGLRVVRYDGRGNGLSDREVADISFGAFVRDLEAVVDGLGLGRFALLGVSQGAAVAIAYAAAHPERVSRIVLHGAYARGRNRRSSEAERELARAFVSLMRHGWATSTRPSCAPSPPSSSPRPRPSRCGPGWSCSAWRPRRKPPSGSARCATTSTSQSCSGGCGRRRWSCTAATTTSLPWTRAGASPPASPAPVSSSWRATTMSCWKASRLGRTSPERSSSSSLHSPGGSRTASWRAIAGCTPGLLRGGVWRPPKSRGGDVRRETGRRPHP